MPREADMRPYIDVWLRAMGQTPVHECLLYGYIDVLGISFLVRVGRRIPPLKLLVAVELKLDDIAGVLNQATNNRPYVHLSYAAMPVDRCGRMRNATRDRFRAAGIGLLSVGGGLVSETIRAVHNPLQVTDYTRRQHWRRYRRVRHDQTRT